MKHPFVIRTDQTDCFNPEGQRISCQGTGQDGEFNTGTTRRPELRFADHGETVTDRQTALMWTKNANLPEFPLTWSEALDYITDMNAAGELGFNDWRLPDRTELFSLLSHIHTNPALPSGHLFFNVFNGYYWTSSTCARLENQAWYVHLGGAKVYRGMKYGSYMVWPVRGGGLPSVSPSGSRYRQHTDTVVDTITHLMWTQHADSAGPVSWQAALDAVQKMNSQAACGYRDWHLPNIRELESLVDLGTHSPALSLPAGFEEIREGYWSSTTSTYNPTYAWVLYSVDGAIGVGYKPLSEFYAWAVRSEGSD